MSLLGCHLGGLDRGYREDRITLLCWLVDPHFFGLAPAASGSAPASWMGLAGLLVDICSLLANCRSGTAVTLVRRDEFDAAVAVLVVVPIHKRPHPLARLIIACKWPAWVVGPVLDRAEQGFREGIVVRNPGPRERPQDTARCQLRRRARCLTGFVTHRVGACSAVTSCC